MGRMTLGARPNAIERAFEVAGLGSDHCGTCGAPDAHGGRVIVLEPGEERSGLRREPRKETIPPAVGPCYGCEVYGMNSQLLGGLVEAPRMLAKRHPLHHHPVPLPHHDLTGGFLSVCRQDDRADATPEE